jgi:ATP-dependent Clp protease adaptor protein ClpS
MSTVPAPDTEQELEHDLGFIVADSGGESASVFIHNDDVTPWDFVVHVLRAVFFLAPFAAERITSQAHHHGMAHVMTLPVEEAKYRVGQAHSLARAASYPLQFTIETEPD